MQTAGVRIPWHRTPIDRDVLAELNRRRDLRPLVDNLGQLGFMAGTAALALHAFQHWSWPLIVLTAFLHTTFFGHYGSAAHHELAHKTVFKTRWLNELFYGIACLLNWKNAVHMRHSHGAHHRYTTHHEHELEVVLPSDPLRWKNLVWVLTLNVSGLYGIVKQQLRWAFRRRWDRMFTSEWERRIFPRDDANGIRSLRRFARFTVLVHAALLVLFIASGNWYLIVLVQLAPFANQWYRVLTHSPQHIGMRPEVADWRQNTRTYISDPVSAFFYWNLQYHVEHHMYAAVPYYNLPKLRKAIGWDLPVASRGLLATWKEMMETVRRQRRDSGYFFTPPLPAGATPYVDPDYRASA